jgi:hypothetical protein
MEVGFAKTWRSLLENPIWLMKPFSKGQAFADLFLRANFKDSVMYLGNEAITVKRGQLHTSELKLADRWGWSRKKVRDFLRFLEGQEMVTTQGTSKGTTITLTNYDKFQSEGPTEGPTEGPSKEHQKNIKRTAQDTHKNKVIKEKKGKEGEEDIYTSLPLDLQEPFKKFLNHRKQIKKPMGSNAIELMLKKLNELSEGNTTTAKLILEQSIINGWVGIFPIKDKQKTDFLTEVIREGMKGEPNRNGQDYEDNPIAVQRLLQER